MAAPPPRKRLVKALSSLAEVPDPVDRLEAIRSVQETLEQMAREAADEARAAGTTWKQIGAVYGVSKQAAQQRFRRRTAATAEPAPPAAKPETAPPAQEPASRDALEQPEGDRANAGSVSGSAE